MQVKNGFARRNKGRKKISNKKLDQTNNMSKIIEIQTIPYSDRIIDHGINGISLVANDSLNVNIIESITHDGKGIEKTVSFIYRHKGKTKSGRYLRITVFEDKVGWSISNIMPTLFKPKNLKQAHTHQEIKI